MGFIKYAVFILCLGFALQFLKTYVNGGICKSKARLDGKIVIVTGANTGLGKTSAEELAKRRATVIMACRDTQKGDDAKLDILDRNLDLRVDQLHVMQLDLASMANIQNFVRNFKLNYGRLDILINNAGVMEPPYSLTDDGFEITIGVNYLGHFLLTNLLMDSLISSGPSRVVTVSSNIMDTEQINLTTLAHPVSKELYIGTKAYAQRLANVLFTRELGRRLQSTATTTYAVHPGIIITDIIRYWPLQQTTFGRRLLYWGTWWFTKEATAGVQTILCCAVDEVLAQETGQYYSDCAHGTLPDSALNDDDARKLWQLSIGLVNMDPKDVHPVAL